MWGMDSYGGKGKGGGMMDMMMMMQMMQMMKGKDGKGWGKDKGKPSRGPGSWGKYYIDESGGVLGEFTGTIKSFNARTGYGFIESPEVQALGHKDVWMHGDMKKDYDTGDVVTFTAFVTGKGQLQCKGLKKAA
eukprot:TRINITY_DN1029_c0_g1_i2.p2 TRINITY_DN1029_c0_g1~~TRINITY_DN1029_c0_g1_i2.p2  ORF type:complete len:133 (-),score=58.04 TRINITY_DN1029_c0_g1_i2:240-638(-)